MDSRLKPGLISNALKMHDLYSNDKHPANKSQNTRREQH